MQSALFSVPLASTPPQHTPSRTRRTTSTGVVAFRSTASEGDPTGSVPHGTSSIAEADSWRSLPNRSTPRNEQSSLAHTCSVPKSVSFVKVEGFDAPSKDAVSTSPPSSPSIDRAASLLSRQLSAENLGSLLRGPSSQSPIRTEQPPKIKTARAPSFSSWSSPSSGEHAGLLRHLQSRFPVFSEALVVRAFSIAKLAHCAPTEDTSPQVDGDRAFSRSAGSAAILAELGADEVAVAGALLHDVLDCTSFTESELQGLLKHQDTFDLVQRVSHLQYVCHKYRTAGNTTALSAGNVPQRGVALHLVSMLVALGPPRALLVQLAVALQDMRTSAPTRSGMPAYLSNHGVGESKDQLRHRRNAAEAIEVWAPLANRLGVWSLKAELEDRAFRTLRPAEYAELRERLESVQQPTRLVALVDALRVQLQTAGIDYVDLSGRPKHLWGVWRKMQAKGYSAEKVQDVRGVRVIVKSREDCYRALRAVETAWNLAGPTKNYIKDPKPNGYQSLHAVADPGDEHLVEIQIRTDKMHYLAEYGADASHWRYKEGGCLNSTSTGETGLAREANWAKFLTSQHVARDKKCRPSGSPSGDKSLESIIASMDDAIQGGSASSSEEGLTTASVSPGSNTGRTFQEYINASGQRPAPPSAEESRTLVAVVAGSSFSVAELSTGTTVGQLLRSCGAELAPRTVHVMVNRQMQSDVTMTLCSGDMVELYMEPAPAPTIVPSFTKVAQGNMMPVGALARKLSSATVN